MKTYTIAAIPGDGIGTEVVAAGVEVAGRNRQARRRLCIQGSITSIGAASTTRSTAA